MRTPRWARALSRLNVLALLGDQFRYLTNLTNNKPAVLVRLVVVLVGPVAFSVSMVFHVQMQSVGDLTGALGLFAGIFLSAFAVVFGLRVNFASRPTKAIERKTARLMDESALTLLAAALVAGVDAIWLSSVSVSLGTGDHVSELATAITIGLSSLVVVYFLLSVRRMHKLYTDTFLPFWKVKAAVDGPKGGKASSQDGEAAEIAARRNS